MIAALAWANLTATFLVELAGLAAFGVWGAQEIGRASCRERVLTDV